MDNQSKPTRWWIFWGSLSVLSLASLAATSTSCEDKSIRIPCQHWSIRISCEHMDPSEYTSCEHGSIMISCEKTFKTLTRLFSCPDFVRDSSIPTNVCPFAHQSNEWPLRLETLIRVMRKHYLTYLTIFYKCNNFFSILDNQLIFWPLAVVALVDRREDMDFKGELLNPRFAPLEHSSEGKNVASYQFLDTSYL